MIGRISEEISRRIFEEYPRMNDEGIPERILKGVPGEIRERISEKCWKKPIKESLEKSMKKLG